MKRFVRSLGVLSVVVFALAAVSVASASAANHFKASETGTLTGTQTSSQVFTTGPGKEVVCSTATTTGNVTETEAEEQKVAVSYSGCKAFGFASATVSKAEYMLHANGEVDVLNTITISVPLGGCHVTVAPQEGLSSVSYANTPSGEITESSSVSGIEETSSGSLCGSSGPNASYTGSNVVHLGSGPPSSTLEWVE